MRNQEVFVEENTSVEKKKMTQTQAAGAIQYRHGGESGEGPTTTAAGVLFKIVVGGLAGDDDVMHVALAEPGPADADEARLLL